MIVINIVTTTYPNRLEPIIKKFVQKIHILRIQINWNLLFKHSVKKKVNMWEISDKTVGFITTIDYTEKNCAVNEFLACWSLPVVARCEDISRFHSHRVKLLLLKLKANNHPK